MPTFDPLRFLPVSKELSVVPTHGESWLKKWANWWAGATIAAPTLDMVAPASQSLANVRRLIQDPVRLDEYYQQEIEDLRAWVRRVLGSPESEPVILDASGTAAILTASRILSYVELDETKQFWTLTTTEGGSLVPATLKGKNPNELEKVMFQPVTRLFYEPEPVLAYPAGVKPSTSVISLSGRANRELVERLREEVLATTGPGCIVLPHVTKTGRILPIREVGQMVSELRSQGRPVFYIVDDIQGMGRMPIEAVSNPTSFCDAYLFGSSKALGGILIASAVVMKKELLEAFCEQIESNPALVNESCFSHFQFAPIWENRLAEALFKPGALSLPELVSMRAGLYSLYIRGTGNTFSERKLSQLRLMRQLRAEVVQALVQKVPGVSVLESTNDRPLVPSIVSFQIDKPNWTPAAFKRALQEDEPVITLSAPIDRYVRLDIPEYRTKPSIEVLVAKILRVLDL